MNYTYILTIFRVHTLLPPATCLFNSPCCCNLYKYMYVLYLSEFFCCCYFVLFLFLLPTYLFYIVFVNFCIIILWNNIGTRVVFTFCCCAHCIILILKVTYHPKLSRTDCYLAILAPVVPTQSVFCIFIL